MKFGIHLTARDWDVFRRQCALAEDAGFTHLWLAETPFFARDSYVALTEALRATRTCCVAPGCTNVVLRHEALAASGLASVDSLDPGRVICGIGSGDRAVRLLGQHPTPVAQMRKVIARLRQFWAGEEVDYDGPIVRPGYRGNPLPVYLFAEGVRTLALGGEVADGVVVGSGIDEGIVSWALDHVRKGMDSGERSVPPDMWFACFASVDPDVAVARDAIRPRLANRVRHNYMAARELVPEEHRPAFERLLQSFDLKQWHEQEQAALVTDFMVDRFTLAGPPESVLERLDRLTKLGVDGVVVNFPPDDFDAQVDRFARQVIEPVGAGTS